MELSHYGNTDTVTIDADEKERYTSITLIALSAGAHLNAICHITPSFGLFAGISARRPLVENIHHQAGYHVRRYVYGTRARASSGKRAHYG